MFQLVLGLVLLVFSGCVFGILSGLYVSAKTHNYLVSKTPMVVTGLTFMAAIFNICFQFFVFMTQQGYVW